MKKPCLVLVLLVATGLMGCFGSEESDFKKAIAAHLLEKKFCTAFGLSKEDKRYWIYLDESKGKQLEALKNENLANPVGEVKRGVFDSRYTYVEITSMLSSLVDGQSLFDGRFCFGKFELVSIENWTESASDASGRIITMVDYVYKLTSAPAWTSSSTMRAAFPDLDKALSPGVKETIKLVQTHKGWEPSPY
jgi:hypothetical protein